MTDKSLVATDMAPLIQAVMDKKIDTTSLKDLLEIQKDYEANEARKAFVQAMSQFRAECPDIEKTRTAYESKYAGLAETIAQIKEILSKWGLSHSWKTVQDSGLITVTCCVTHAQGHSECTSLSGSPDTSGSKNAIQSIGSTVAYLERYTLFAILGLASKDMDDDGQGADKPIEYITEEQSMKLQAMLTDNDIEPDKMKPWLKSQFMSDEFDKIPADSYALCLHRANATIAAKKKAAK